MKKNKEEQFNTSVNARDRYHKALTGLFCTFVTGVMIANVVTPSEGFSPTENRTLAQMPEISQETLSTGTFMTDFETYLSDQFVGRDHWVALKSVMEKVLMKQENNEVFFASNDTLINKLDTPSVELMEKNAGYINTLAEKVEVPVYMGMIPTAANVWKDRLPLNAPTADETAIINQFYSDLSGDVTTIPLREALSAKSSEDIYYRTDHHWTTLGAYYGYVALMESMGITPVALSEYRETVVSDSFYGTTYSTSGVRWVQPDRISTYVPDTGIKVTSNFNGTPEEGYLYVPSKLEEKDKYAYFLGGVQPLCIVETEHTDKPSLLIIRDSYSDCLLPFLTPHFSEIQLLDLRYYNAAVSSFVNNSGMDHVLVLYSLSNFVDDGNLFKLGM